MDLVLNRIKINELLIGLTKLVHPRSAVSGKFYRLPQAAAVDGCTQGYIKRRNKSCAHIYKTRSFHCRRPMKKEERVRIANIGIVFSLYCDL